MALTHVHEVNVAALGINGDDNVDVMSAATAPAVGVYLTCPGLGTDGREVVKGQLILRMIDPPGAPTVSSYVRVS